MKIIRIKFNKYYITAMKKHISSSGLTHLPHPSACIRKQLRWSISLDKIPLGGAYKNFGDNVSEYSVAKSSKANQHEIVIDIHVKHLKLKVNEKTALRVVWSRGKKQAKTQVKILNASLDKAVFDEKFQINTILELDPDTGIAHVQLKKISF